MAGEWFCKIAGTKHGPYTPQQLKALVAANKLHPEDLVRHGAEGQWLPAERVKGLFSDSATHGSPSAGTPSDEPTRPALKKAKSVSPPGAPPKAVRETPTTDDDAPTRPSVKKPASLSHQFAPRKPSNTGLKIQLILAGVIAVLVVVVLAVSLLLRGGEEKPAKGPETAASQKPVTDEKKPEAQAESKPAPEAPQPEAIVWHKAAEPLEFKDEEVRVKVQSVSLASLAAHGFASDKKCLIVAMKVENASATKKIDFSSWGKFGPSYARVGLTDNHDNKYKLYRVMGPMPSIYPKQDLTDELIFEPPIESAQTLKLVLPAAAFGGKGDLRLEIPRAMITVEPERKKPVVAAKPPDDYANPGMLDLDQKIEVKSLPKAAPKLDDAPGPKMADLFSKPEEIGKKSDGEGKKTGRRARP